MNLEYNRLDILEAELSTLPLLHQIAFAASCCKRLFPTYNIFLREIREQGWNEQDPIRIALNEIWEFLALKKMDKAKLKQLLSDCDEYPYGYTNSETAEIQRAAWIVSSTLEFCLDPTTQNAISAIKHVHETLFEYLCESLDDEGRKTHTEVMKEIANHPFTIREMAKQSEDLQRLKESVTLNRELLEWLRTSFDNDGKSILDLS